MSLGANELYSAEGITEKPKWPELSMNEIHEGGSQNAVCWVFS